MTETVRGKWMSTAPVDMLGVPFEQGDKVARAITSGRAVNLEITEVTRIEKDKVYLGGSKAAIHYPSRLLIVNKLY